MFLCVTRVFHRKNSYGITISLFCMLKAPKISLEFQVENRVTVLLGIFILSRR